LKRYSKKYKLKVSSDSSNLELIRKFVFDVATKSGFSIEDANKIELAVDEACSNVVKHAYRGEEKETIEIDVNVQEDRIIVKVKDKGKGFNPQSIQPPDMVEYLKQYKMGGLGIHIIKSLMDEIDFKIKPGIKNEVIMVKFFQPRSEKSGKRKTTK